MFANMSSAEPKNFDIAMVGSHAYGIYMTCDRLPKPGETVAGRDFIPHADDGGKGSNQAICAGRLGASVLFIGMVGNDAPADIVERWLRESGADTRYLFRTNQTYTGLGVVLIDAAGGEVVCAVDMGANRLLGEQHVRAASADIARARFFMTQFELPAEIAIASARLAKSLGLTTVVTPGPVPELGSQTLEFIDILTPNETEANVLAGRAPDDSAAAASEVLKQIRDRRRIANVIMTRGRAGVSALCADGLIEVPAFDVRPANTAGAGDAFTAGLVVARSRGADWPSALRFGCAVAALSIQSTAPWRGYPTLDRVADFLRTQGHRLPF